MSYKIIFTKNAVEGILRLRKAGERQALKKIDRLLSELGNIWKQEPASPSDSKASCPGNGPDTLRSVIVSFLKYSTSM